MKLSEAINSIKPVCRDAARACQTRWDSIAKPLHSLGRLEDVLIQIAGITGSEDIRLDQKALVVMCADNGVVAEGVTQTGQEVTAIVADNFLEERATAGIMCRQAGADIFPVDIGVAADTKIIDRKIAYGTKNMAHEPAMSHDQLVRAIETGIDMVRELQEKGYRIIATGEMGIGNTTTSSAVASLLLNQPVEVMTGRGAGLSDEGLARKKAAIRRAIEVNQPDAADVMDVLAKVGGLDIAGLTGVFIGGAVYRVPIVIDGVISAVSALCAVRLHEGVRDYMIPSHVSKEPAAAIIMEALGLKAHLTCDMHLGEGTGAVLLYPMLDMSLAVYRGMTTFDDISIEAYKEEDRA